MRDAREAAQEYIREDTDAAKRKASSDLTQAVDRVASICSGQVGTYAQADQTRFEVQCLKFDALSTFGDMINETLPIINEVVELLPPAVPQPSATD